MFKRKSAKGDVDLSEHSVTSCRSSTGHSTRLVHYLKPAAAQKDFQEPEEPFIPDYDELEEFKKARFIQADQKIGTFASGRSWGAATGPGIGTFLMTLTWACQLFMTLTVTAVPFWILITRTSGFFGSGSRDLRNPRSGIPYMQPHSFTTKHPDQSFLSFLPGLSFAGIFEDKGDVDLTSEMRFESFSDLGRDHFLLIVGLFDVLAVLFLLFFRRLFKQTVQLYEKEYDASVQEIADYTVIVTAMPPNIKPSEADAALVEYFNSHYSTYQEETGASPVAEVYPITAEGDLVKLLKKRRELETRLLSEQRSGGNACGRLVTALCTGKMLPAEIAKAKEQYEDVEAQVQATVRDSSIHKVHGAFVVFNEPWLADKAVESAPRGWLQRLFVPRANRLCGTHVVSVEPATEPSTYIYENLAVGPRVRAARAALSKLAVFVILAASLAVVVLLKSQKNYLLDTLKLDTDVMRAAIARRAPDVLPLSAAVAGGVHAVWSRTLAFECSDVLPTCPDTALNPFPRGVNVTMDFGEYIHVQPEGLTPYYTSNFLQKMADCAADPASCDTSTPGDVQVACLTCYCYGLSEEQVREDIERDYFHATVAKAKCKPFLAFDAVGTGIDWATVVIVACVNVALGPAIRALTLFERHRSRTEEHASLCWRTTVAQFLNTSVTPLVASAEIRWASVIFGGVLFKRGFPDFTTNWYVTTGTQVVEILLVTSMQERVMGWVWGVVVPAVTRRVGRAYTQEQLHEMHLNAGFDLGRAFAEISLVTMQALLFGAGIPVLYVIAAVAMFVNAVDTRAKLRHVWPLPRRFGTKCTYMYLTIVKGMAYLHTFFAVWMLSYFRMHGQIVDLEFAEEAARDSGRAGASESFTTWFRYERILQVSTWAHCALLVAFFLYEIVPACVGTALKILRIAAGLRPDLLRTDRLGAQIPFMEALHGGKMRGMASYNVAHVERAVLFADADLEQAESINGGLAPFPAAAAALGGRVVPQAEDAFAPKSLPGAAAASQGERLDPNSPPDVDTEAAGDVEAEGAAAQDEAACVEDEAEDEQRCRQGKTLSVFVVNMGDESAAEAGPSAGADVQPVAQPDAQVAEGAAADARSDECAPADLGVKADATEDGESAAASSASTSTGSGAVPEPVDVGVATATAVDAKAALGEEVPMVSAATLAAEVPVYGEAAAEARADVNTRADVRADGGLKSHRLVVANAPEVGLDLDACVGVDAGTDDPTPQVGEGAKIPTAHDTVRDLEEYNEQGRSDGRSLTVCTVRMGDGDAMESVAHACGDAGAAAEDAEAAIDAAGNVEADVGEVADVAVDVCAPVVGGEEAHTDVDAEADVAQVMAHVLADVGAEICGDEEKHTAVDADVETNLPGNGGDRIGGRSTAGMELGNEASK